MSALIHVSQISQGELPQNFTSYFPIKTKLRCKIQSMIPENNKVSLTLKDFEVYPGEVFVNYQSMYDDTPHRIYHSRHNMPTSPRLKSSRAKPSSLSTSSPSSSPSHISSRVTNNRCENTTIKTKRKRTTIELKTSQRSIRNSTSKVRFGDKRDINRNNTYGSVVADTDGMVSPLSSSLSPASDRVDQSVDSIDDSIRRENDSFRYDGAEPNSLVLSNSLSGDNDSVSDICAISGNTNEEYANLSRSASDYFEIVNNNIMKDEMYHDGVTDVSGIGEDYKGDVNLPNIAADTYGDANEIVDVIDLHADEFYESSSADGAVSPSHVDMETNVLRSDEDVDTGHTALVHNGQIDVKRQRSEWKDLKVGSSVEDIVIGSTEHNNEVKAKVAINDEGVKEYKNKEGSMAFTSTAAFPFDERISYQRYAVESEGYDCKDDGDYDG